MDIGNKTKQNPVSLAPGSRRLSLIGRLLMEMGKLTPEQLDRIINLQQETGLPFGQVARKLGLVSEADIRMALAIQFDYSYVQTGQSELSEKLVAAHQPYSLQTEALRAVRSMLALRWFDHGNHALAVVAAHADEGCGQLAANLAVVFSQLGARTLLIDGNLRQPSQHAMFNIRQPRGLSDIIVGRAGDDVITSVDGMLNLSVLGAGTVPPNPQELLNRASFSEFMRQMKESYDVVLVDTPPAIVSSDAQALASRCGGALLISRMNETRLADVENIKDQLALSNAQLVAAIVHDF